MTSLTAFTVLVALVGLERLAELVVSNRNAAWSFARGGRETGQGHYRFMVVLHSGFLVAMLVEAWVRRPDVAPVLAWSMLVLVLASQGLRWWCITTLGRRWNTRIIIVPGLPRVTVGAVPLLTTWAGSGSASAPTAMTMSAATTGGASLPYFTSRSLMRWLGERRTRILLPLSSQWGPSSVAPACKS